MPPPCDTRVKESIVCRTPSSSTAKSDAERSVTRRPPLSRPTAPTRMAVVLETIDGRCGGAARPASGPDALCAIARNTAAAQDSFMALLRDAQQRGARQLHGSLLD